MGESGASGGRGGRVRLVVVCGGRCTIQLYCMPERKVWSGEEDRILKLLIEERGLRGWTQIARTMEEEFNIAGRSGKQCRERYHNHLDGNINTAEWSASQQQLLFSLQDELGNKWKLIASSLPGRTDNCIKNHFYSKLRKSLRSLNRKIHKFMKKDYKQIKPATLYRLIETLQNRNKIPPQDSDTFALCRKIKNHLYHYESQGEIQDTQDSQELSLARNIIEDFALFEKDIKRPKRGSLQSSAKLSEGSRAKGESTRSLYDDSSECSSLFSSSSFDHRSLCGSQRLPNKLVFRSQDIQPESESDNSQGEVLYKSATSLAKAQHLMPPIQQESAKRESSKHSHSSRSDHSAAEEWQDKAHAADMFEESMEMRAISPQQLTALEKMEIREESNDALFYGEMEIDAEGSLASDFSRLALTIPVLGKYTI